MPSADRAFDVDVGGRDDADVGADGPARADRPDLALLQHAQQLDLQRRRHLADFVEKHRAGVRGLEHALGVGDGAGERALDVAEQLRFEQRLGRCAPQLIGTNGRPDRLPC